MLRRRVGPVQGFGSFRPLGFHVHNRYGVAATARHLGICYCVDSARRIRNISNRMNAED